MSCVPPLEHEHDALQNAQAAWPARGTRFAPRSLERLPPGHGGAHSWHAASPLQRRIALNVLAVLIQGGGADALQVAPRQRRLDKVADVQAAAAAAAAPHRPRADERVHLHMSGRHGGTSGSGDESLA